MSNSPRPGHRERTAQIIEQALACGFVVAAQLAIEMTDAESEAINRSANNLRHVEQLIERVRTRIGRVDAEINFATEATERGVSPDDIEAVINENDALRRRLQELETSEAAELDRLRKENAALQAAHVAVRSANGPDVSRSETPRDTPDSQPTVAAKEALAEPAAPDPDISQEINQPAV